ncbi:coiled-coil domain-containing protein 137 [Nematolebias whitei]|uniref:coiled-coil domain-containing protein 137 n=1 Tax=Nematolebias whitei TaxID=451745 RepID=UPI00189B2D13|nr:coiled-coil domain-containing protein 137 [Nematolebias whitei]
MGKNRKNQVNRPDNQVDKVGRNQSKKKQKRDGKPKKPEDHLQHIPFRLREMMKSKEKMKAGAKTLRTATSPHHTQYGAPDGDIPVPHFRRGKHESVGSYVSRMETETKHVLFLTKNQVDRKPELDADEQEKLAGKEKSEKKKEYAKTRLNKLQQKKLDKQETRMEREMFVDNVPFGEVAMAPPSLSAKPKKAQVKNPKAPKQLLLNSLLGHTAASTAKPSMARQRLVEEERRRVVEAYRQLKKQKQSRSANP